MKRILSLFALAATLADHSATAALYDLKHDLAERYNLISDAAHAARVKAMEKIYREIRASKRSTITP